MGERSCRLSKPRSTRPWPKWLTPHRPVPKPHRAAPADASASAPEPVRSLPVVDSPRVRRSGPRDWDEIEPGSFVLAFDGDNEAWFEAIVVQVLGSAYRVRFRDYPEEGVLMRRRENIALLFVPEPTPEPESAPQAT